MRRSPGGPPHALSPGQADRSHFLAQASPRSERRHLPRGPKQPRRAASERLFQHFSCSRFDSPHVALITLSGTCQTSPSTQVTLKWLVEQAHRIHGQPAGRLIAGDRGVKDCRGLAPSPQVLMPPGQSSDPVDRAPPRARSPDQLQSELSRDVSQGQLWSTGPLTCREATGLRALGYVKCETLCGSPV